MKKEFKIGNLAGKIEESEQYAKRVNLIEFLSSYGRKQGKKDKDKFVRYSYFCDLFFEPKYNNEIKGANNEYDPKTGNFNKRVATYLDAKTKEGGYNQIYHAMFKKQKLPKMTDSRKPKLYLFSLTLEPLKELDKFSYSFDDMADNHFYRIFWCKKNLGLKNWNDTGKLKKEFFDYLKDNNNANFFLKNFDVTIYTEKFLDYADRMTMLVEAQNIKFEYADKEWIDKEMKAFFYRLLPKTVFKKAFSFIEANDQTGLKKFLATEYDDYNKFVVGKENMVETISADLAKLSGVKILETIRQNRIDELYLKFYFSAKQY